MRASLFAVGFFPLSLAFPLCPFSLPIVKWKGVFLELARGALINGMSFIFGIYDAGRRIRVGDTTIILPL
jgi:hypothetical protein